MTAVTKAVEGRQRLLQDALASCCWRSPPKEPRCSSHEMQRARDLRQRRLLVGQQRDAGERLSCAGEVISERQKRGRCALSGKVHADGAAVNFLAFCPVYCCACAVRMFKRHEAEPSGCCVPVHGHESVNNSPTFNKRDQKRISGGAVREITDEGLDPPAAAAAATCASASTWTAGAG